MWKVYGLKKLPKISFCETKQIIPDKNLFGKSNFATNAFDVLIQLTNRNGSNAHHTGQSQPQQVRSNPQTPKGDSENGGGANEGARGNVKMKQFTNGAIDDVNVNQLIEDVCSSSNDGDQFNNDVISDIGRGSDSDSDDNNSRETNQRGTYGESDFGGEHGFNGGDGRSVISSNDVLEEDGNGNENKIGDNKLNLNSQEFRRNTNVLKEGQNDRNNNH